MYVLNFINAEKKFRELIGIKLRGGLTKRKRPKFPNAQNNGVRTL
jgi:hypothetical protein